MRNEFQRHRKSDKVKWVFTGVAFLLVFVMLAGVFMQLFASDKFKPSNWFTKTEQTEELPEENTETGGGETVITETTENGGVSIMSSLIEPMDYDEYGVSAAAERAYSLTATVTPADATFNTVHWSMDWENPSSTWASGKTVTDYMTLTSDGLNATLSCLKAFGEQIIVTITSIDNTSLTASCTLDYAARITGFGLSHLVEIYDSEGEVYATPISIDYLNTSMVNTISYTSDDWGDVGNSVGLASLIETDGTVSDNISSFCISLTVADSLKTAINSALGITCVLNYL